MKRTRNATQAAKEQKKAKRGKSSDVTEISKSREEKQESDLLNEFELSSSRKQKEYTLDDMLAEKKSGNKSISDIILEVQKELASSEDVSGEHALNDSFDNKSSEVNKFLASEEEKEEVTYGFIVFNGGSQYDPFSSLETKANETMIYSGFTTVQMGENENFSTRSFAARANEFFTNLLHSGKENVKEYIKGGYLLTSFIVPRNTSFISPKMLKLLFEVIAYSEDRELVISSLQTWLVIVNSNVNLECIDAYYHLPLNAPNVSKARSEPLCDAIPGYHDLKRVLSNYGCVFSNSTTKEKEYGMHSELKEITAIDKPFQSIENLGHVIFLMNACVAYRPQSFKKDEIVDMILITMQIMSDVNIIGSSVELFLETFLNTLMDFFQEDDWINSILSSICQKFFTHLSALSKTSNLGPSKTNSLVSKVAIEVIHKIPITGSRGKLFQSVLSVGSLQLILSSFPDDFVFNKELLHPEKRLNESLELTSKLQELCATQDYTRISTCIELLDCSLNDRETLNNFASTALKIRSMISTINQKIREVSGYNIALSKAKDSLIFLKTKLPLLISDKKKPKQTQLTL